MQILRKYLLRLRMAEGGFMRRATDVGFTLVERIAQWEREYGANIAVRDRETTYTYTELFDAARRFASCLASEGIEAGDRIVLQLPNKAESLIILFGSVMRGCIPVLALPTHRKAEISHFCSKSNASCLIVPCSSPAYDYESLAKAIKKDNPRLKCFVIGSSDQYRSVSDMRGELWQATAPHSSSFCSCFRRVVQQDSLNLFLAQISAMCTISWKRLPDRFFPKKQNT